MVQVIKKKNDDTVPFDKNKLARTIKKALVATEQDYMQLEVVTDLAVRLLVEQQIKGEGVITTKVVRECVEEALDRKGFSKAAKIYKNYETKRKQLHSVKDLLKQSTQLVDNYFGCADWNVKENSNMRYSLQGLNNYLSSNVIKHYWLYKIFNKEIREAHEKGDVHVHDLGTLGAYCCGWDLQDLLMQGFGGVVGKTESAPPKHLSTALGQAVNFLYSLQGETAGAQAFSSFDTLLAPFVRYDKLTYKQVKQSLQEFVFGLNISTRVGFQTPFTNITLDLNPPSIYADTPVIIGGVPQKETYKEFQEEMNLINKAFCEVMMEGDYKGRVFTFPIPTYNITKDFNWDDEKLNLLWEMTAKYGVPYFANFINSDLNPEDARSMCCRLRLDNRVLRKRGGGLFGANPLTGSVGVVTLNLARAAYISEKNYGKFITRLGNLLDLACESLLIKRNAIEAFTEQGLYPYAKHYLSKVKEAQGAYWGNHFNTIGVLGMNEACLNLIGETIATPNGKRLAFDTLQFIRERLVEFQKDGFLYNLEATPGEGTTYRFAKLDKAEFPKIISAGKHEPYYTNSTHLPVDQTADIFEALRHQDSLQALYTGGTVLHGFLGERIDDCQVAKRLVKKIAENFQLPYFTLTPTFSVCSEHGYIRGEHFSCPHNC